MELTPNMSAGGDCAESEKKESLGAPSSFLTPELRNLYRKCNLCPRGCGVDRCSGQVGVCGATDVLRLGRAALHWWEEPCLVGQQGSGAVFFSYCPMHCVYCQNRELACGAGVEVDDDELERIFLRLQNEEHVANINLVTPTHYLPHIVGVLRKMRGEGSLVVPVVYNCSGYESVDALRLLDGLVDVYLVDFKYSRAQTARSLSSCADYPTVALSALGEMLRQVGAWCEDPETGLLRKGVIVRHLVLPGHIDDSAEAIALLVRTFPDAFTRSKGHAPLARMSIMNQFVALEGAGDLSRYGLGGQVSPEEYDALLDLADDLGVEDYFWQEGGADKESFIPAFDGTGILPIAR